MSWFKGGSYVLPGQPIGERIMFFTASMLQQARTALEHVEWLTRCTPVPSPPGFWNHCQSRPSGRE
eukprot:110275-Amphidinium_carterae.1